jgi:hypothetical protein
MKALAAPRRIVQIAASNEEYESEPGEFEKQGPHSYVVLYALADDGTVWTITPNRGGGMNGWDRIDPLPYPEQK